jgi:hypothetical protein
MSLDIDLAQQLLNTRLRENASGSVRDDEWSYLRARAWQRSPDPLEVEFQDAQDCAGALYEVLLACRGYVAAMPRPVATSATSPRRSRIRADLMPAPPEWWATEAARIIEDWRSTQQKTLLDFGLFDGAPVFLDLPQVSPFLEKWGEGQVPEGDPVPLAVPTGYDDETEPFPALVYRIQVTWRGWSSATLVAEGRPPSHDEFRRQGALVRLHDASTAMARETGCEPEEAVAFLLCDLAPSLPWIELLYDDDCEATLIRVRHPEVSAREVAQAYRALPPGPMIYGGRLHQRRRRLWPERVETFVGQYRTTRPKALWGEMWEAFQQAYPDASEHYTGVRSFQQTYYTRIHPADVLHADAEPLDW